MARKCHKHLKTKKKCYISVRNATETITTPKYMLGTKHEGQKENMNDELKPLDAIISIC